MSKVNWPSHPPPTVLGEFNRYPIEMNPNPYASPSGGADRSADRPWPSRCPVCGLSFSWQRKLLLHYRCTACNNRIGFRPRLRYLVPSLVVGAIPALYVWFEIRADPLRLTDFGYWLLVPVTTLHFVPWFTGQMLGTPTLSSGWRWANSEQLSIARNQHTENSG